MPIKIRLRRMGRKKQAHYRIVVADNEGTSSAGGLNWESIGSLHISDSVFLTDLQGRFTFICENAADVFGYTRQEIAQRGTIEGLLGEVVAEEEKVR